ncbi:unnamed protein product [Closterium sp. NIES-54]
MSGNAILQMQPFPTSNVDIALMSSASPAGQTAMTAYGGGAADVYDSGSKFDTASCGGSSVASSNGCHSTTTSATATTAGSGRRAAAAFVAARWGAKVAAGLLHPPRACIRTLHRHLSPSALSPTAATTGAATGRAAPAAESTAADAVEPVMVLLEDGSLRMYSSSASEHHASSPSSPTGNNAPLTVADVLLDFPNHDLVALAAPCAPLDPATRLDPGSTYCLSALPAAKASKRGGAGGGGQKPHAGAAAVEEAAFAAPVSSKARCRCPICRAEAEQEREAKQQLRGLWLAGGEVSASLAGNGGDPMQLPGSASPSRSIAKQRLRQRGSAALRSPRGGAEAERRAAAPSGAASAAAVIAPSNSGASAASGAGFRGAGAANGAGGTIGGVEDQTVSGRGGMADHGQGHGHGKQIGKEDEAARLSAAAAIALAGMPCPSPAGARTETSHVGRVTSRELRRHRTSSPDRPSRFPSRFGQAEMLRVGMGGESAASPLLTNALPPPGSAPVTPRGGLQPVGKERWGEMREEHGLGETEEEEFISDGDQDENEKEGRREEEEEREEEDNAKVDVIFAPAGEKLREGGAIEEREQELHRQRALEELQQAMDKVNAWMEACQEQLRQLQQQGQQD